VAWTDHRSALRALGINRFEFQREARRECVQFLASFATGSSPRESMPSPVA
jgi:hypothetical protein